MITSNYQFNKPPVVDGEEYRCNSMQKYPNTPICVGGKSMTFSGNQINCLLPTGSKVTNECNHRQIEYCANIEKNSWMNLKPEIAECDHCVKKIELEVNGVTMFYYVYENKVL